MEGYRVLSATNGKSGIEIAAKNLPDIIICDVLMPEMDGYMVLKALKEEPATAEIPFIFSTSMSEKIDVAEAYKQGADDYLIKPFDLEDILKTIKNQLKKSKSRL